MAWNHWDYRVIRTRDLDGTYVYTVHECHYANKDDTIPNSWTEGPAAVSSAEGRESLLVVLWRIEDGVTKPVSEERGGELHEVEPAIKITL